VIDAIYSGRGEVRVDTEISFQDGSRQRIRTTMPVVTLDVANAQVKTA
jgi:long-chain acyl-CoA synthetase